MQNITPFLWFDDNAEEAVNFYVSIFKNSKIDTITRYSAAGPGPEGGVMTISFQLDGTDFVALNGGHSAPDGHELTPRITLASSSAISFVVNCPTQAEVDELWERLIDRGDPMQCGWLKDKYGVTWQIVPEGLSELFGDEDPDKVNRAMRAMFEMEKLDINVLRRASEGR
jgi:predicted 3-demethylubiquinone-9 3-methyltransferase (glyoxalase superfamily)